MVEKILNHKHCQVCGDAIPADERFCTDECREKYEAMIKKKRIWMYVFYALMAVFIFMLLFGGI